MAGDEAPPPGTPSDAPSGTPTPRPAPKAKVFDCPNCGAGVVVRAQGQSVAAACGSCGSVIDLTNENLKILSQAAQKMKIAPLIPLGQRGKLRGETWEVIGFMQRSDGSLRYTWSEYLLFNPYKGFRWLTEFDGHWNYVLTTREKPQISADGIYASFHSKSYHLFNRGPAVVSYVLGEFYWRVRVGETVQAEDYVAPPQMLSKEASAEETIWSLSEYIEPEEVRKGFMLSEAFPVRMGIAPNQPATMTSVSRQLLPVAGLFGCLVFLIQFLTLLFASEQRIFTQDYKISPAQKNQAIILPPFTIEGQATTVDVRLYAPILNDWFSAEMSLINEKTGEAQAFSADLEYYSGYDGDGSWSEGSREFSHLLSAVPAGIYHLTVEPTWAPSTTAAGFRVEVWRGLVIWSNAFWAMIAIVVFPLIVWLRSYSFEHSRWSQSDFSPYWKGSDGDDE